MYKTFYVETFTVYLYPWWWYVIRLMLVFAEVKEIREVMTFDGDVTVAK